MGSGRGEGAVNTHKFCAAQQLFCVIGPSPSVFCVFLSPAGAVGAKATVIAFLRGRQTLQRASAFCSSGARGLWPAVPASSFRGDGRVLSGVGVFCPVLCPRSAQERQTPRGVQGWVCCPNTRLPGKGQTPHLSVCPAAAGELAVEIQHFSSVS